MVLVSVLVGWFLSWYWWDGFGINIGGMVLVLVLVGFFIISIGDVVLVLVLVGWSRH